MNKHEIEIGGDKHSMATPFQFTYHIFVGQLVMEVESQKFHKVIINVKCTRPDSTVTFYENV